MPIYEYGCKKCGEVVEKIQKFSDPPLKKHEGCGGALTKLISQSSFHLKGSGWYVTDYAGKAASNDGQTGDGDSKKETSKSDSTEDGGKKSGDGASDASTSPTKETTSKKTTKTGSNGGNHK